MWRIMTYVRAIFDLSRGRLCIDRKRCAAAQLKRRIRRPAETEAVERASFSTDLRSVQFRSPASPLPFAGRLPCKSSHCQVAFAVVAAVYAYARAARRYDGEVREPSNHRIVAK